ncbi:MAG: ParA family protein [Candidatus Saccharimonadales bacterium]
MAVVIAVTNQKGGVGKTTSSVNLAYCLSREGRSVLLVDFDPQGNATSGLGFAKDSLELTSLNIIQLDSAASEAVLHTAHKNLDLIPATPQLANAEVDLAKAERRFVRLKLALQRLSAYDVIIIDSPPSLSLLTVNALIAADYVLLPVQAEFYAMEGLGQLLETMQLIRKGMNPTLELIGVLVTMMDPRTTLSRQVHAEIAKHFPGKVFETVIPRNVRIAEAPSHGLPVGAYDRWSKGARAYKSVTKELIKRVDERSAS